MRLSTKKYVQRSIFIVWLDGEIGKIFGDKKLAKAWAKDLPGKMPARTIIEEWPVEFEASGELTE